MPFLLLTSPVPAATLPSPWDNTPYREIKELSRVTGAQGDYFRLKMAEDLLEKQEPIEALKYVNKVNEPLFALWKDTLLAEVYLAQQKPRQVLALLRDLPEKPMYEISFGEGSYENIYRRALVARYLAQKSLGQNATKEAGDIVSLFPLDGTLQDILHDADKKPALTALQKIDRLHALSTRYKYKDIGGLITVSEIKTAAVEKDVRCRALFELGHALKFQRGFRGVSIDALGEVVKQKCPEDYVARALYWLGSIKPEGNIPDNRTAALLRLLKEFKEHRLTDDAVYKLYKISEEAGDSKKAKEYYEQLMNLPRGDMKAALVFEQGYPFYVKGQYRKAIEIFAKALQTEPTSDEEFPKVLYWYARSLEKTGGQKEIAKAREIYHRLRNEMPFSFYAILGAKRIDKTIKTPEVSRNFQTSPPDEATEYFSLVHAFNEKGYHEAARTVLDFLLHQHPDWENTHQEYLTAVWLESKNYRKALDLAAQHFDGGVYGPVAGAQHDPMFAALYPWAFKDTAASHYQRTALPQGAIEGIMREESLFQRAARSWVGATGLMQLMPATAAMLKKNLTDLKLSENLTDTNTNIALGSTYLRDMQQYFGGQLPLAIMAYNAGPGNVNKWLKRFGHLELDEFIESIPLSETRGYVKRVMRSMQVYGNFYHEPFFADPSYFNLNIIHKFAQVTPQKSQGKKKKRSR